MRSRGSAYRVGSLRPSNFLFSNGIGSVVDLPSISAVVMGIDFWNEQECQPIEEPRLLRVLQDAFGQQVTSLRSLPFALDEAESHRNDDDLTGVPIEPFPGWLVCPLCRQLIDVDSGLLELKAPPYRPEQAHYVHKNCRFQTKRAAIPVRFMRACSKGHLDDFPWVEFVHKGPTTCSGRLRLDQRGVTGEAAHIFVKCLECGVPARSLAAAFGLDADPIVTKCTGRHPHLGVSSQEECVAPARTISLGASNAWFPATYSVISVPGGSGELEQLVERNSRDLAAATSREILAAFLMLDRAPFSDLKKFGADAVWDELDRQQRKQEEPEAKAAALRPPEWAVLTAAALPKSEDFRARSLSPSSSIDGWIGRVVLIDRMRMVQALVGFTRLEAPEDPDDQGEEPSDPASLTRGALRWIPAVESRGEGIFLQFNEGVIQEWCGRAEVQQIDSVHRLAHVADLERRGLDPRSRPFPGMRYLLLHSFSHALMRQIALECGYGAASLRERIYSLEPTDDDGPMAGVLISTSSPDSEGTLGGLVRLGEHDQLSWHVREALTAMQDCASDPYCSEHEPSKEDNSLHGAACHACLFAPETSCERGNRYLDRTVLVDTFSALGAGFFASIGDR